MSGMFWAWSDWEESVHLASASGAEPPKPNEEAFSISGSQIQIICASQTSRQSSEPLQGILPFQP